MNKCICLPSEVNYILARPPSGWKSHKQERKYPKTSNVASIWMGLAKHSLLHQPWSDMSTCGSYVGSCASEVERVIHLSDDRYFEVKKPGSSSLHVEACIGKILNPKLPLNAGVKGGWWMVETSTQWWSQAIFIQEAGMTGCQKSPLYWHNLFIIIILT